MAGYVFAVSQEGWSDFLSNNLSYGFFTPFTVSILSDMTPRKKGSCAKVLAATYGDLITMEPGDNVYFLSARKIYGVGEATKIGPDCKYDNYTDASALLPNDSLSPREYLTSSEDPRARWVFLFKPSPHYFRKGVDMDDVLRFRPQAFRALRAFEGLSFIKIDDEENRALREYISLSNESAYNNIEENVYPFDETEHRRLQKLPLSNCTMDISKSLRNPESRKYVVSEMLIESRFMQKLHDGMADFGKWDYLTHQLIASPFKPLRYIDKIDVFGYQFSSHYDFDDSPRLITKYLLVEMKKGIINEEALNQTMQYVDWICTEYASGDYSRIEAYVIGDHTSQRLDGKLNEICTRSYIHETHPVVPDQWNDLKLVHYTLDNDITFQIVDI